MGALQLRRRGQKTAATNEQGKLNIAQHECTDAKKLVVLSQSTQKNGSLATISHSLTHTIANRETESVSGGVCVCVAPVSRVCRWWSHAQTDQTESVCCGGSGGQSEHH